MLVQIHSFMQNTNDLDMIRPVPVEDQVLVLADRAKPFSYFVTLTTQIGKLGQTHEARFQLSQVLISLLRAPPITAFSPNTDQIVVSKRR